MNAQAQEITALKQYIATLEQELAKHETEKDDEPFAYNSDAEAIRNEYTKAELDA